MLPRGLGGPFEPAQDRSRDSNWVHNDADSEASEALGELLTVPGRKGEDGLSNPHDAARWMKPLSTFGRPSSSRSVRTRPNTIRHTRTATDLAAAPTSYDRSTNSCPP